MIEYTCPNCSRVLRIPEEHAGTAGRCNHCGEKISVPQIAEPITEQAPTGKLLRKRLIPIILGVLGVALCVLLLMGTGRKQEDPEQRIGAKAQHLSEKPTGGRVLGEQAAEQRASGSNRILPGVTTSLTLSRFDVVTRFTTMVKTDAGWTKATVDDLVGEVDESKLKNENVTDWHLSYAQGTYSQTVGNKTIHGEILDLGALSVGDGSQYPFLFVQGQFFMLKPVKSATPQLSITTITNTPDFVIKEDTAVSADGTTKLVVAEGLGILILDPRRLPAGNGSGFGGDAAIITSKPPPTLPPGTVIGTGDSTSVYLYKDE